MRLRMVAALGAVAAAMLVLTSPALALDFSRADTNVGQAPFSVAIGDLNNNGQPDLAVANEVDGTVSVLLGDGSGDFTSAAGSPVGTGGTFSVSVAVGDLNGDGNPDLAVANELSNNVSVLLGDGSGGFSAASGSPIAVGSDPYSVAIGDVNSDARKDLVVANSGSGSVSVLLGNGSGGFTAASGSPFSVGSVPRSVAIGDLNSDGHKDLAVANYLSGNVSVLLGDGSGGFTAASGSPFAVGTKPYVAMGDLNGDGNRDLVTANFADNDVSVLLGDGSGGFTAASGSPFAVGTGPQRPAIGDLSFDGKPDLVIPNLSSGNFSVLLGNGAGGFSAAAGSPFAVGTNPISAAIGDLSLDGRPDLAVANLSSNSVSTFVNTSRPSSSQTPSSLGFGSHQVDTESSPRVVTVTNTSDVDLHVAKVKIEGTNLEDFAVSGENCTDGSIGPNAFCTVRVRFAPGATGIRTAVLRIISDDPASPASAPLSGTGTNTASCQGAAATVIGTSGADVLVGTPGHDVIAGLGGDDQISGKGGNDLVCGGSGDDQITTGSGKDTVFGGSGDDVIHALGANDVLHGGSDDDLLDGGTGTDSCDGGSGTDTAVACEAKSAIP